jgi:mRNA-degrading endonuclease HigB of HigAB toxin-antitoxin module
LACDYVKIVGAVNKAELMAEADQKYIDHIHSMVEARRLANIARVQFDAHKVFIEMIGTKESSKRAEMTLR